MKERMSAVGKAKVRAAHQVEVLDTTPDLLSLHHKHFHLIGIGGVGMSALARVLLKHGAHVSGSDAHNSVAIDGLRKLGAQVEIGHRADHVKDPTDVLVMSAAVKPDNPELQVAQERGIEIFKYAQMLGEVMNRYQGIAVAGTHGKSTTSGWLSYVLNQAGVDVNYVVGAGAPQLGGPSGVGDSPYFVAEACEYDRSFLNLRPCLACLLNIEVDHLDYYRDEADILDAFTEFALGIKHGGGIIANGEDPRVAQVLKQMRPDIHMIRFGFNEDCDVRAVDLELAGGCYRFRVEIGGRNLGQVHISLAGKHNVMNALAVVAVADYLGLDAKTILACLGAFTGIDRRMMLKGCEQGITVLDDYAHHPTEIRCTLEAIRQRYPSKCLWCVFQPHQHSRTRFLLDDFAESFKLADVTIVPEIYFVRDSEQDRQEINAEAFVARLGAAGCEAAFINDFKAICDSLCSQVRSGDVVVTMGAGDVWKVADEFIQRLRGHC